AWRRATPAVRAPRCEHAAGRRDRGRPDPAGPRAADAVRRVRDEPAGAPPPRTRAPPAAVRRAGGGACAQVACPPRGQGPTGQAASDRARVLGVRLRDRPTDAAGTVSDVPAGSRLDPPAVETVHRQPVAGLSAAGANR